MRRHRSDAVLSAAVLAAATVFVVVNLRPGLWFVDNTPTGGDLGAHVWAPAYLRDVLLGELRLTGWTHDWYAGFPAFTFYMVVPSLLVVIVDAGIDIPLSVFVHLAALGAAAALVRVPALSRRGAGRASRLGARVDGAAAGQSDSAARASRLGARVDGAAAGQSDSAGRASRLRTTLAAAAAAVAAVQLLDLLDGRTFGLGPLGALRYDDTLADRAAAALLWPAAAAGWTWFALRGRRRVRLGAAVAAALLALLMVPMPYGAALKLVAVAGVVALPAAAWGMARLAKTGAPGEALAAAATLPFLFDRSFNIYGGNLMSTMAGEFAYSLGLACALVYIGVAARGMASGAHRVLAGALLALAGLLHLFCAFFALAATAALALVLGWRRGAWRGRLRWTLVAGSLAAALSAWWVLPFWWNRGLLNDMGWGKERSYVSALWSRRDFDYDFLVNHPPLQPFVVLAAVAAALCVLRRHRLGMALSATSLLTAVAFVALPEGRLWNVRILPFYYLTVYLVAALGAGEAIRWAGAALDRLRSARREATATAPCGPPRATWAPAGSWCAGGAVLLVVAAVMVLVGLPLRSLPGGRVDVGGVYRWGPFNTTDSNLGPHWVKYNFEGYEGRAPTDAGGGSSEYWDLVDTMARVGESRGCGTSLWEYDSDRLGSYGTPMAPMLLPYWTDGCIGSMEGLYFEASATVPYHFLMQSELSVAPSRAQRDLPYSALDVARGVEHLRIMGVRYYLAFSDAAVGEAREAPGLSEVAASGPWVVFEVSDSAHVEGLAELPVVVDGLGASGNDWLTPSVGAFLAGAEAPLLAADGPDAWPRMSLPEPQHQPQADDSAGGAPDLGRGEVMRQLAVALPAAAPREALEAAVVSDVVRRDHAISFSVDRVGSPVLVRTSYFPNWSASGADGPYRVTPNFMVVVPTDTEVRLTYGRSRIEWLAMLITLAGLLAAARLTFAAARHAPAQDADAAPGPGVAHQGGLERLEEAGAAPGPGLGHQAGLDIAEEHPARQSGAALGTERT